MSQGFPTRLAGKANITSVIKMRISKYGYLPILILLLLSNITALQNGMDRGFTYCTRGKTGTIIKVEKGDSGSIASVGYPGNYTVDAYQDFLCNVEIQACRTCKIRLTFVEMTFPACRKPTNTVVRHIRSVCVSGCDHLRLFEVDQPYHSSTEQNLYTEDEGTVYESISSKLVILHCMSNISDRTGKRFHIKYEVVDKIHKIQGTVTSPLYSVVTGQISSPNFPHGYALNGETFTYVIQNLDPYGYIRLVFDDWDIASKSHIQVYDDLSGNTKAEILRQGHRPTLISNTNTMVIVFNVGEDPYTCCTKIGFRATYQFVSDKKWWDKPKTDCGESFLLRSGGTITFDNSDSAEIPRFYDCVWTIKRYISNYPDRLMVRLDEISMGEGWLQPGINSLELYEGITSIGTLLAKYTSSNMTNGETIFTTGRGFYIRLRGVFNSQDIIKLVYTGVNNLTSDGCDSPSDFMCDNLLCIHQELTCDGVNHCGDNSDENPVLVCQAEVDLIPWSDPLKVTEVEDEPCFSGFRCQDNRVCIPPEKVCDRLSDCQDDSDEKNCNYSILFSGQPSSISRYYDAHLILAILSLVHWFVT